jgi:protein gp37
MGDKTGIEWTQATWNPVVGCSILSAGCTHCYAMREAHRLATKLGIGKYAGTTTETKAGPVWNGTVRLHAPHLDQPLRWRRPRRIFVNSMSDLFHEDMPDEEIDKVFAVMALAHWHTFQVLTKRPERMLRWFTKERSRTAVVECCAELYVSHPHLAGRWPFDKDRAVAVGLNGWSAIWKNNGIGRAWVDWVVCGGESGPRARPMHPDWARSLRDQCAAAGVPFLFKQWGEFEPTGPSWGPGAGRAQDMAGCVHVDRDGYIYRQREDAPAQSHAMRRAGKKAAGRLLDGVLHDGYPDRAAPAPRSGVG